MNLSPVSKALAGAAVGGLTAAGTALLPDSSGGVAIVAAEWVSIALAAIVGSGIVYAAPANTPHDNDDPPPE